MASILHGLLCGLVLVRLHRPPGRELLEVPAVDALTATFTRGIAFGLVALAVLMARRSLGGRSPSTWLAGVALGTFLEGVLGGFGREADGGSLPFAVIGLVLFVMRERRLDGPPADHEEPATLGRTTLILAGTGLGLGFEGLARHVRRLGAGLAADDAVFTATLSVILMIGALCLGPRPARRGARSIAGVLLPICGAALLAGLVALRGMVTGPGLRSQLGRFGLDAADYGQPLVDLAVAGSVFSLPAVLAGAVLARARRRGELALLLLGAGVGVAGSAPLLQGSLDADLSALPHSGTLVTLGIATLGLASLLDALSRLTGGRELLSIVQLGLGMAALGIGLAGTPERMPLQHWTRFPVQPRLSFETPEGLFMVLPGATPGVEQVLLNGHTLTPSEEEALADGKRLELSLSLPGMDAPTRVLLVGQLTPGRAVALARAGVEQLDVSASWWRVADRLNETLFSDTPSLAPERLGLVTRTCSPAEASGLLEEGVYDLVIVPAASGRLPLVPDLEAPEGTVIVVWYEGRDDVAVRSFQGPVLVSTSGLGHLAIAAVSGVEPSLEPAANAPAFLPAGPPIGRGSNLAWMGERASRRGDRADSGLAMRLASGSEGTPWEILTRAFADHTSAQIESSPWATLAEATELDEAALDLFVDAAITGAGDLWTRELGSGLAEVLVGKRDVEGIYRWIEPIAEVWGAGWIEGSLALASADLESLEPDSAVERLTPLFSMDDPNLEIGTLLARAQRDAGLGSESLVTLRTLARTGPLPRSVRRDFALALAAAGELEEARRVGLPLLAGDEDHDHADEELAEALGEH